MMATVGERIHDIDDDAKEMVNTNDSYLESTSFSRSFGPLESLNFVLVRRDINQM